jgi:hypothetical protein
MIDGQPSENSRDGPFIHIFPGPSSEHVDVVSLFLDIFRRKKNPTDSETWTYKSRLGSADLEIRQGFISPT